MIARSISHQMSREISGHHVICNVTKFQSCGRDKELFITYSAKNPSQRQFEKNNIVFVNGKTVELKIMGNKLCLFHY